MSLVLSDAEVLATGLTESELRVEIAVVLFQQERLSLARASRMAVMPRLAFQRVLASRRIAIHYTPRELDEDMRTLAELGLA